MTRKKQLSQTARELGFARRRSRSTMRKFGSAQQSRLRWLGRGSFRPVFPTPAPVPVPSTRSPLSPPSIFAASSTWLLVLATREGRGWKRLRTRRIQRASLASFRITP